MRLRTLLTRPSAVLTAVGLAGATLLGCPQLLDDGFDIAPALPGVGLDSHNDLSHVGLDAGDGANVTEGGSSGATGAGGEGNTAGSGGSSQGTAGSTEQPDASAAGASGSGGEGNTMPDATPPPSTTELGPLLAHRYRFSGTGPTVLDYVGTANGTVYGTTVVAGSGKVSLAGSGQYVDLPDGIISSFQSVTLEAWVNWLTDPQTTGANWQDVFDFGANDGQSPTQGTTHLYVAAKSSVTNFLRAGYTLTGYDNEVYIDGTYALPVSANAARGTQVALVADGALGSLTLYIDGAKAAGTAAPAVIHLSDIQDVNNWLGKSQYSGDPTFHGEILDFRIYGSALSLEQIQLSNSLGPDADL